MTGASQNRRRGAPVEQYVIIGLEIMVRTATSDPMGEPIVETDLLLGQASSDSTQPLPVEGHDVTALVTSRQGRQPGASDVSFTVVPAADATAALDSLAVTLTGSAASRRGRIDPRGRCVIRDVPDARYALRLRAVADQDARDDHP